MATPQSWNSKSDPFAAIDALDWRIIEAFESAQCFFILKWLLFVKEEEMLVRFNIQMSSTTSQPLSSLYRIARA